MTSIELEEKYIRLKEILIDNYDECFNKYLLMDFYEGGYEGYISEQDELYYLEDYSAEIAELLIDSKDLTSNINQQIKTKLIGLKKHVDFKITKNYYHSNPVEIDLDENNKKNINYIELSDNLVNKKAFSESLWAGLIKNDLIESISFDKFNSIFQSKHSTQKLKWISTESIFAILIESLEDEKCLNYNTVRRKFIVFSRLFKNQKGELFKNKQLSKVYSENTTKELSKKSEQIKPVIKRIIQESISNKLVP